MSNRFYNFVNQLISGSVAKSSEVNAQFQAVDTAAAALELELNRAIKFPAGESATNQVITQSAALRQGYVVGFDDTGQLVASAKFWADWDADNNRLRNLPQALANDEPVTLGQLNAYSTSLVTGMPSISGQDGPLTTDGATVIWDSPNRLIPATASVNPTSGLIYTNGVVKWGLEGNNIAIDPNGTQGTAYWTSTLSNVEDHTGYHWRNASPLAASTFDHKPTAAGHSLSGGSKALSVAATVNTAGVSVGTITMHVKCYSDAGTTLLSTPVSQAIAIATATDVRYQATLTTDPATVYVAVWFSFSNVTATAAGVIIRNLKLEYGSDATEFNDNKTIAIVAASKSANPFGTGFATPYIVLGDATTTTADLRLRSQTGVQVSDVSLASTGGTDGTANKGTLTITSNVVKSTGPIGYTAEYDAGNSGASKTIDFLNGSRQKLTLNAATPAITISAAPAVGHYQLKVIMDVAGRLPTWVGFNAVDCVGNAFPVMASGTNYVTFVYLYWDGAQYFVSSSQWD